MTVYIREYERLGQDQYGRPVQAGVEPALASHRITSVTATSAQSALLNARTRFVRISTDAAACVTIGVDPTATQDSAYLATGQTEFFPLDENLSSATLRVAARTP